MEVVNFRVGDQFVAFNILDILLTEKYMQDETPVPSQDPSFLGMKEFMGVATPIYDLGKAMNGTTTQEINQSLSMRVKNAINNIQQTLVDSDKSRLTLNAELPELRNLHATHPEIKELLQQAQQTLVEIEKIKIEYDNQEATKQKIRKLLQQLGMVYELIEITHKPVTVYTTQDGHTPKTGFVVDEVSDSLQVRQDNIKPLENLEFHTGNIDPRVKNMLQGLLTHANKNSLLLKPEAFYAKLVVDTAQ
ncbi:hypothetical protein [Catenovulum sediminis]|uniref:Uncharacterized protein n=1 Tax=Catenovulum sediminis TaxID=1740262 RepID=A0ABV1RIV8_9ALTE|nr:hypothetical protein [Catenovulum sediminis]